MSSTAKRSLFLLIVLLIAAFVLVYPTLRLTQLLAPNWHVPPWLAPTLMMLPLSLRVLHAKAGQAWSRALSAVVMTWLGLCFITLTLLLPAELLILGDWFDAQHVGYVVALSAGLLGLYGFCNALSLHIRTVPVQAPAHLQGKRLVQISDVHIGSRQPGLLTPIVHKINQLQPDFTLITGDLIDMHGIDQTQLAALANIQSPTLFCIGNHERYVDVDHICNRLKNLGIEVLRNTSSVKGPLQFIGIDDAERKDQVAQQLANIAPVAQAFKVLLYHRPDGAEAAAQWGADLMLTGHTHRGQIFPFNFLVQRVFPRLYRSYQVDHLHMYVSPGTGTWGPVLRLGSKCEITLFTLM